jgi:hypothetical protein
MNLNPKKNQNPTSEEETKSLEKKPKNPIVLKNQLNP